METLQKLAAQRTVFVAALKVLGQILDKNHVCLEDLHDAQLHSAKATQLQRSKTGLPEDLWACFRTALLQTLLHTKQTGFPPIDYQGVLKFPVMTPKNGMDG